MGLFCFFQMKIRVCDLNNSLGIGKVMAEPSICIKIGHDRCWPVGDARSCEFVLNISTSPADDCVLKAQL